MASYLFDLKPCTRLTVSTVGPAGQRTFYLQGVQARQVVSVVIEKQHAQALANAIDELIGELEEQYPLDRPATDVHYEFSLLDPVTPLFYVGRLGLGYEPDQDLIAIFVQEMLEGEDVEHEPAAGRLWADREHMQALSAHIKKLVAAGRPVCALCGNPIDPDGHFCPQSNGHASTKILQ